MSHARKENLNILDAAITILTNHNSSFDSHDTARTCVSVINDYKAVLRDRARLDNLMSVINIMASRVERQHAKNVMDAVIAWTPRDPTEQQLKNALLIMTAPLEMIPE